MGEDVGDITATWDDVLASNFKNYVVGFLGYSDNILNPVAQYDDVPFGTYDLTVKAITIEGTYGSESKITIDNGTTGYTKTVPAEMTKAILQTIYGRTIVWNQAVDDSTITLPTPTGVSITMTDHIIKINGTASSNINMTFRNDYPIKANHTYLVALASRKTDSNGRIRVYDNTNSRNLVLVSSATTGYTTFTSGVDCIARYYFQSVGSVTLDLDITPLLFDLTQMFGAGNEPTLEQFQQMFPASYYGYNAGTLLSAKATSVVSKSGGITVETYNIPSAVQSLTGYGWSCPLAQNYIDFVNKKFVQNVGSRSYASGDEADSSVITDGTNTYYKLNSAVKTTITITDNDVDVVGGGNITFANDNGSDYCIPILSTVVYT